MLNTYTKEQKEKELFQKKKEVFQRLMDTVEEYVREFAPKEIWEQFKDEFDAELVDADYTASIAALDNAIVLIGKGLSEFPTTIVSSNLKKELTPDDVLANWLKKNNI